MSFSVEALLGAWFTVIGACIGSFLNVVIYRLPRGFRLDLPRRSHCTSCLKQLSWFENIPVFSFLVQGGHCRHCNGRIGPRYPLVEILTALLFYACFVRFGFSVSAVYFATFTALCLAATFIDLDFRIIPDEINFLGLLYGLALASWVPDHGFKSALLGAFSGWFLFWLLATVYERVTKREGLGLGDVKFLAMIGAYLGIRGVIATMLLSSLIGTVVGIPYALWNRSSVRTTALPFGPFLAIAALLQVFWGDVLNAYLFPIMELL